MIKVIFDKNKLIEAVGYSLCAVSERNTLKALEGILFQCEGQSCVMSTYDMEKGVRQEIPAVIEEPGSFIVNANKLFRIIRTLTVPNVTIEIDEKNICRIYGGSACFEMFCQPGKDFPGMPYLTGNNTFSCHIF